jgi:hypothetical protein
MIRLWAESSVAQPHGLREPYVGIILSNFKVKVGFYLQIVKYFGSQIQLNLLYTKIMLVLAI